MRHLRQDLCEMRRSSSRQSHSMYCVSSTRPSNPKRAPRIAMTPQLMGVHILAARIGSSHYLDILTPTGIEIPFRGREAAMSHEIALCGTCVAGQRELRNRRGHTATRACRLRLAARAELASPPSCGRARRLREAASTRSFRPSDAATHCSSGPPAARAALARRRRSIRCA